MNTDRNFSIFNYAQHNVFNDSDKHASVNNVQLSEMERFPNLNQSQRAVHPYSSDVISTKTNLIRDVEKKIDLNEIDNDLILNIVIEPKFKSPKKVKTKYNKKSKKKLIQYSNEEQRSLQQKLKQKKFLKNDLTQSFINISKPPISKNHLYQLIHIPSSHEAEIKSSQATQKYSLPFKNTLQFSCGAMVHAPSQQQIQMTLLTFYQSTLQPTPTQDNQPWKPGEHPATPYNLELHPSLPIPSISNKTSFLTHLRSFKRHDNNDGNLEECSETKLHVLTEPDLIHQMVSKFSKKSFSPNYIYPKKLSLSSNSSSRKTNNLTSHSQNSFENFRKSAYSTSKLPERLEIVHICPSEVSPAKLFYTSVASQVLILVAPTNKNTPSSSLTRYFALMKGKQVNISMCKSQKNCIFF